MQTLRHPVFLSCVLLFLVNQGLELMHIYIPFLFSYLDDLLVMPIVLTLALAAERAYFRNSRFVLPWTYVAGAVLAFGVCFEALLPLISLRHKADLLDVLAYAVGAVLFHLHINQPLHSADSQS